MHRYVKDTFINDNKLSFYLYIDWNKKYTQVFINISQTTINYIFLWCAEGPSCSFHYHLYLIVCIFVLDQERYLSIRIQSAPRIFCFVRFPVLTPPPHTRFTVHGMDQRTSGKGLYNIYNCLAMHFQLHSLPGANWPWSVHAVRTCCVGWEGVGRILNFLSGRLCFAQR